jgi:hypothetical protein
MVSPWLIIAAASSALSIIKGIESVDTDRLAWTIMDERGSGLPVKTW